MKKLHECYGVLEVTNNETRLINRARFEALTAQGLLPKLIEEILQKRKEAIGKVVEPAIKDLLLLLAQLEPRFRDIVEPLTDAH